MTGVRSELQPIFRTIPQRTSRHKHLSQAAAGSARRALRPREPRRAGRHDVAREGRAGRRARQAAGEHDVGQARGDDARRDQEPERLAGGLLPAAAPAPRSGRDDRSRRTLIDETKKQTDRDLDALRPRLRSARSPAAGFPGGDLPGRRGPTSATSRRASSSRLDNFERLFKDILNQKQLEGLRLLLTPFPQQQFNATEDRRSLKPQPGRRLLRLPRQRAHQRRHAHGRRHPAERAPAPHRHAVAARRRTSSGSSDRSGR